MKNIWIINEYAGTPNHGMEFRHYYLGKELVKLDDTVTVISSSYSHLFKNLPAKRKETIDGVNFLWMKTINYGTSHDRRRVLKWFLFSFKVFFLPLTLKKPDVIIVSPMAPFPIFPAWVLSKLYGAKLIYEVKDIWPLSLIELGGFKPTHPFMRFMAWFERFALNKSDVIVSNLQNYGEHIKSLGIDRDFEWISNGVDLDELSNIALLSKEIEDQLPIDKFIVGYTGTIGVANALDSFLEAAKLLGDRKEIAFVLVGGGQEQENLMKNYSNLDNIHFVKAIAKKEVQNMLTHFEVCFIGLQKENLFKYGVSPNKLYDYMYSAKPIIFSIEAGKNIVDVSGCGISTPAQDPQAVANAIVELFNIPALQREFMGQKGKAYVLEHFTYEKLAKKLKRVMQ